MTEFRNATEGELRTILDWAASEGWNPGLEDGPAFYAADPDGFFVATVDGDVVAAISVVNHTPRFAFLGLYITQPAFRGQGIGYGLWQHAIGHAEDRTVGLDGVPDQQANYAKSGFEIAGGTTRFAGPVTPVADSSARLAEAADIPKLIASEAAASGVAKEAYLAAWFSNTSARRTIISAGGVCTVRRCQQGAKIGPLLAHDKEGARALLHHAATVFGPEIIIDVPEKSAELAAVCRELNLSPGFETARMYRGAAPAQAGDFYAVTSLELG